jgi:hypothetical protein
VDKQQIEEHWQSTHGQRQATDFLNRPSAKRAGEFLNLTRNQLRIMTGLFIFTGIKTGTGRQCDRWRKAFEMVSEIFCD